MFTQWWCVYKTDGDVTYCQNITELATSQLTGIVTLKDVDDNFNFNAYKYNVSVADVRGWYQRCWYDRPGWSDSCDHVVVVPVDTEYVLCVYDQHPLHRPKYCYTSSASHVCQYTQPSTNRLLHQTVPPPVYIIGLVFNILIILVIHVKADKTVLNFLLLMLSVWDLLYLGCLLVESVIGHYAHTHQIQISDVSYVWLYVRCKLGDSSACDIGNQWYSADNNIGISTLYYPLMYWLHIAALVFQIASVYQTTVIATFRCIAIRWPFQASQLLTSTTAAVATGCCLLLGVAVHVPAFIAGETITDFLNCKRSFNEYKDCLSIVNITHTAKNPLYSASTTTFMNLYHHYHIITYSIILFLALPFLLLLVLNIVMLAELYRGCGPSHDDENKAVTKVVTAIVTVFLISYIVKPLYIVDIYYFTGYIMDSIASQSCGGYFTASLIITILPALNSVINLLLYLGLRQTFRQQFISMFSFCKRNENLQAIALQQIYR